MLYQRFLKDSIKGGKGWFLEWFSYTKLSMLGNNLRWFQNKITPIWNICNKVFNINYSKLKLKKKKYTTKLLAEFYS